CKTLVVVSLESLSDVVLLALAMQASEGSSSFLAPLLAPLALLRVPTPPADSVLPPLPAPPQVLRWFPYEVLFFYQVGEGEFVGWHAVGWWCFCEFPWLWVVWWLLLWTWLAW
ncbi:unnamed protein product, partial [Symbiodinium microadriaticum]